jgi:hypothetical protein
VTFHYGPHLGPLAVSLADSTQDLGRIFPEWTEVTAPVLEGTVTSESRTPQPGEHAASFEFTPHVTYDDIAFSHFTHDLNIHVAPDPTPDNRYTNLLGIQVEVVVDDPCADLRRTYLRLQTMRVAGMPVASNVLHKLNAQLASPGCRPVRHEGKVSRQGLIEVEWESGLGADNDGNACAAANRRGDSCGFASAGLYMEGEE